MKIIKYVHILAAALIIILSAALWIMYETRARERATAALEAEKAAHEISRLKAEIKTQGEAINALKIDMEGKRKTYDRAVAAITKSYERDLAAAKKSMAADPSCENRLRLITQSQENFLYEVQ